MRSLLAGLRQRTTRMEWLEGRADSEGTKGGVFDRRGHEFWTEGMAPEFFGHRHQSSMTRATAEDSTPGLGPNLPYGTSSGWWVTLP